MPKANPHPFESWDYIAHVAKVNAALSDCLGLPIDPNKGAAKVSIAQVVLANLHLTHPDYPSTFECKPTKESGARTRVEEQEQYVAAAKAKLEESESEIHQIMKASKLRAQGDTWAGWPRSAAARAKLHEQGFPWLPGLFGCRPTPAVCPVWQEAWELIALNDKFTAWVNSRLKRNPVLSAGANTGTLEGVHAQVPMEVSLEAARILIGKAEELRDKTPRDGSWVVTLLCQGGNRPIFAPVAKSVTGQVKLPGRDQTIATADPVPPWAEAPPPEGTAETPKKGKTKVKSQTSQVSQMQSPGDGDGSGEELLGSSAAPSPVAGAVVAEMRDDIAKLTEQEGQVIQLYYYEEKTWKETAAAMKCTVYNAQQHHESALEKLRRKWIDD